MFASLLNLLVSIPGSIASNKIILTNESGADIEVVCRSFKSKVEVKDITQPNSTKVYLPQSMPTKVGFKDEQIVSIPARQTLHFLQHVEDTVVKSFFIDNRQIKIETQNDGSVTITTLWPKPFRCGQLESNIMPLTRRNTYILTKREYQIPSVFIGQFSTSKIDVLSLVVTV